MMRWSAIVLVGTAILSTPAAAAEHWVVWRQGQVCHVAAVPVKPIVRKMYPEDISKGHKDEKGACIAAKDLKTNGDEPSEKKCFTYSTESAASCKSLGVVLTR